MRSHYTASHVVRTHPHPYEVLYRMAISVKPEVLPVTRPFQSGSEILIRGDVNTYVRT